MIAALVSGEAALKLEGMPAQQILALVMQRLRHYHGDRDIPDPVDALVTRWAFDEYARGSYSSVPPGCKGAEDYRALAANVGGRLFFAGEATSHCYPAQMHGAYDSGLREVRAAGVPCSVHALAVGQVAVDGTRSVRVLDPRFPFACPCMQAVVMCNARAVRCLPAADVRAAAQAAKVAAALSGAASGRTAADAAAPVDTRSPAQLSRALQRALRLSAALAGEFAQGSDLNGPGWCALLALTAPGELCGYAIVQATWQARKGRDAAAAPPPSYHLAPLEVCTLSSSCLVTMCIRTGPSRPSRVRCMVCLCTF